MVHSSRRSVVNLVGARTDLAANEGLGAVVSVYGEEDATVSPCRRGLKTALLTPAGWSFRVARSAPVAKSHRRAVSSPKIVAEGLS